MGINGIKLAEYYRQYGKRLIETKPYNPCGALKYVSNPDFKSIALTKSISKKEAIEMIMSKKLPLFSAFDREVPIKINGQEYIGKWIDGGGSKCAYRVNISGEDVCILLPHNNWGGALNEPYNTIELKKLGLLTNDYCKIIPVEVKGTTIPALASKPYDKHSFKIFDKKNPNDCLEKYYDLNNIREDNIEEVFTPLLKDIKALIDNNIRLGYDSFNLALKDGRLRLYLNDLPYEKLAKKGNSDELLQIYLDYAIETVPASIGWGTIKKYPFVDSLGSISGMDKITPKLREIYNKLA